MKKNNNYKTRIGLYVSGIVLCLAVWAALVLIVLEKYAGR